MNKKDLIDALSHLKVETGSLACFGCGHEHNCGIHGCAIIREAVRALQIYPVYQLTGKLVDQLTASEAARAEVTILEGEHE